jgi:hypothetical protein
VPVGFGPIRAAKIFDEQRIAVPDQACMVPGTSLVADRDIAIGFTIDHGLRPAAHIKRLALLGALGDANLHE